MSQILPMSTLFASIQQCWHSCGARQNSSAVQFGRYARIAGICATLLAYLPHCTAEEWRASLSAFRWVTRFQGLGLMLFIWMMILFTRRYFCSLRRMTRSMSSVCDREPGWISCIFSWMRDPCGSNGCCTHIKPTTWRLVKNSVARSG
jgi:hypothetical protein